MTLFVMGLWAGVLVTLLGILTWSEARYWLRVGRYGDRALPR